MIRLIAVQVLIHASMTGMRMAAPLLALRQEHGAIATGALISLFALAPVFLSVPAGRFADRNTLQRPVALSVLCAVIGAALAAVFPVFPVLCLSALLSGGAVSSALIALQRHTGRMATNQTELRQVFSWLALSTAISSVIGPFLSGLIIDHANFRAAFALMAVLPVASWFIVRRIPTLEPPKATVEMGKKRHFWDLLRKPPLRRLLALNWIVASSWDVHTFVVPLLGHERGFSASAIGAILGIFAVAAAIIRLILPVVAARLREWAVIFAAMLTTAALYGIYPVLESPLAMGACSLLLGAAIGSVQPMIMSALHQITPEHRQGEALGLRMMSVTAAGALMPMAFGGAGHAVGLFGVFWGASALVAAGSRLAWKMQNPGDPDSEERPPPPR